MTELTVGESGAGFHIEAEVQLYDGVTVSADDLHRLIAAISAEVGVELTADVSLLYGDRLNIDPAADGD